MPYITIFGAVIVAAWYGGVGPALLAAAAGYLAAHGLFIQGINAVELALYAGSTGLIAALGGARRLAGQREEASEARFRTFMEHAPAAVFMKDEAGRYVYMNAAAQRLVKSIEWQGRTDHELMAGEPADEIRRHDLEVLQADAPRTFELTIPGASGPRHYLSTKFPLRNATGERFIGSVTIDVTEQQRGADEYRRQREELRLVTDSLSAGMLRASRDMRYVWVNRVYAAWVGRSPEELAGKPILDVLGEDGLKGLRPHIERLLAGQRVEYERLARFPRLGQRWVHSVGEPTRNERGEVDGWVSLVFDIHQRREAADALEATREQLQLVADSMPAAVALCSRDLRYVWVNRRCASWLGTTPEALAGRPMGEALGKENMAAIRPYVERVLAGEQVRYERLVRYPGMGERWVRNIFSPVQPGETWIAVVLDVHDQKLLEQRMQGAERRQDEFLVTLAHELRNPLAPIRNAMAILGRKGGADPELEWSREVIRRQIDELSRRVDDLSDLAHVAGGTLKLDKTPSALGRLLDQALETAGERLGGAAGRFVVERPHAGGTVEADMPRLVHALSRLLEEAARRAPQDQPVALSAAVQAGEVVVSIRPPGAAGGASTATGVLLAEAIIALHGGRLEVARDAAESTLVRLPLAAAPAAPMPRKSSAAPAPAGTRVLVADDNRDAADSLQRILSLYGYDVRVAYDGTAAMRLGEDFEPAVAVLDIGMPGANGYEVARHLRNRRGGAVKLIAVTGWGQETDRRRAIEAGFDYHLTKPVEPGALHDLLAGVADPQPQG